MANPRAPYDALVVVSFGGPEGPEDVLPFLRNVVRGRDVPEARLLEVAEHYHRLGGVSPLNGHNRALVAALTHELSEHAQALPVYWGNRNWAPYLDDTVAAMRSDGVGAALAFVTSAYDSYSSRQQYLEDIARAQASAGAGAPAIDALPVFYDHPGFVEPWVEAVSQALGAAGRGAPVLFSAHGIPLAMAAGSDYVAQLQSTAALVAQGAGLPRGQWQLVYQSRSGPPTQPWLEPALSRAIQGLPAGTESVVVAPIGFVSDHMEVVYDIDTEAAALAAAGRGTSLVRAATPGTHPRFVAMVRELVEQGQRLRRP